MGGGFHCLTPSPPLAGCISSYYKIKYKFGVLRAEECLFESSDVKIRANGNFNDSRESIIIAECFRRWLEIISDVFGFPL